MKEARASKVIWWANAIQRDSRAAWKSLKAGLLLDCAEIGAKGSLPPVLTGAMTSAETDESRRREVHSQDAANELGGYVRRLSAQDVRKIGLYQLWSLIMIFSPHT